MVAFNNTIKIDSLYIFRYVYKNLSMTGRLLKFLPSFNSCGRLFEFQALIWMEQFVHRIIFAVNDVTEYVSRWDSLQYFNFYKEAPSGNILNDS